MSIASITLTTLPCRAQEEQPAQANPDCLPCFQQAARQAAAQQLAAQQAAQQQAAQQAAQQQAAQQAAQQQAAQQAAQQQAAQQAAQQEAERQQAFQRGNQHQPPAIPPGTSHSPPAIPPYNYPSIPPSQTGNGPATAQLSNQAAMNTLATSYVRDYFIKYAAIYTGKYAVPLGKVMSASQRTMMMTAGSWATTAGGVAIAYKTYQSGYHNEAYASGACLVIGIAPFPVGPASAIICTVAVTSYFLVYPQNR